VGTIEEPLSREDAGTHLILKGRFAGRTRGGDYSVPYEISVPVKKNKGNGRLLFEAPHFTQGALARDAALGREYVFGQGYCHATVGYSNRWRRLLDLEPDFKTVILGRAVTPAPPGLPPPGGYVTDTEILAEFINALKANPRSLTVGVEKFYAIGFSDSGNALHFVLRQAYAKNLFDLSVPCGGGIAGNPPVAAGSGRVIFFNTESDFDQRKPEPDDRANPLQRTYVAAGCPHICDTPLTRVANPTVAGTSPIDGTPFVKALLEAGDRWVTKGAEPPPSLTLKRKPPVGAAPPEVERDARGNALGGIRHPALVTGEARFIASGAINPLFGGYDNVQQVGGAGFFPDYHAYRKAFEKAAKDLRHAGFISQADEKDWIDKSKLNPPATFTQNYQAGRFPFEAGAGRGGMRLNPAELDATRAQGAFELV
jgi:hypothetical protein